MTRGALRTDRPGGYGHRKTRPGVHQRERRGGHKPACPSTPDPPIYPMVQTHRRACLQVHPSSTPGSAPLGTRPDEQHWNQIIARLLLSILPNYSSARFAIRKPDLASIQGADEGPGRDRRNGFLYSNVAEIGNRRARYRPCDGLSGLTESQRTTPHISVLPRHNWRTMHR